jgi:hypothetical protein
MVKIKNEEKIEDKIIVKAETTIKENKIEQAGSEKKEDINQPKIGSQIALGIVLLFVIGFITFFINIFIPKISIWIFILLNLYCMGYYFKINQKYVAITLITIYLIPFLIFGGCLLIMNDFNIG